MFGDNYIKTAERQPFQVQKECGCNGQNGYNGQNSNYSRIEVRFMYNDESGVIYRHCCNLIEDLYGNYKKLKCDKVYKIYADACNKFNGQK